MQTLGTCPGPTKWGSLGERPGKLSGDSHAQARQSTAFISQPGGSHGALSEREPCALMLHWSDPGQHLSCNSLPFGEWL